MPDVSIQTLCCLLFFLVSPFLITIQARKQPDWVVNYGQSDKYDEQVYLTGFGEALGISRESKEIAQENARADLSQKVLVKIDSTISNYQLDDGEETLQQFSTVTQSSSELQVMGLETLTYVRDSRKNPMSFALVYIERKKLAKLYQAEKKRLTSQILQLITLAENQDNPKYTSVQYYYQTWPLLDKLAEVQTILLSVLDARTFSDLASQDLEDQPLILNKSQINRRIQKLSLHSIDNLDDVAGAIQFQLYQQFDLQHQQLLVQPFFYQDTRLSSRFARYFKQLLEGKLENSIQPHREFQAKSVNYEKDMAVSAGADYIITGSYWEKEDNVQILAFCRSVQTGEIRASANVNFKRRMLRSSLNLKPDNFEKTMSQQLAFEQEVIDSSQLKLEVWTDRGQKALLYSQGELMKVYLRTNRPCYVRLLYILANGQKTLLVDNLQINLESINRPLLVNDLLEIDFECTSPFGAEMIIGVARNYPFDTIETTERDGYIFIDTDNPKHLASITRGTKGFKRRKRNDESIQQTETKLILTTVAFDLSH
ncbi:hypothetical protein CMK18_04915 [Candidatus Poribacteria bacterium]|nr:hypothetical protein [Candidatus Poribacteria bacterium]